MNTQILKTYIEGGLSDEERRQVADWIIENDENRSEYKALRQLYDISLWNPVLDDRSARRKAFACRAFLIAASLALIITTGIALYQRFSPVNQLALDTITVPSGREMSVDLADGSQVQLNAGSRLRICSARNERRVHLDGEGYFIIAPNPKLPFIVETFGHSIKVTGTEFNVKAREAERLWEVDLVKGSVSILNTEGKEVTALKPGKKITMTGSSLVISKLDENTLLWKDGILSFDNLTLDEILDRISDYYGIRFESSSLRCGQKRFTGKFRTQWGYEHILKSLQMIHGDFAYEIPSGEDDVPIRIY